MAETKHQRIHAVVRGIPRGRVATYGQVAALAGLPGQSRLVGYALHRGAEDGKETPWHRVVNARGEISARRAAEGSEALQRRLLRAEGVRFGPGERIDLERYRWEPEAASAVGGRWAK
jgi:methylated-DNA-protein-cysteine methyltransferase related protein